MNSTVFHFQEKWTELSKRLPEKLLNLPPEDLTPGLNTSQHYIKLRVVQRWPIVREKETPVLLKILTQSDDGTNSKKIPVFFLGKLSEACQTIKENDILVLSNFRIERNRQPSDDKHSCQINLDVFQPTYIWIATEPAKSPARLNHHRGRSARTSREPVAGTSSSEENMPVSGASDSAGASRNANALARGLTGAGNTLQGSPQRGGAAGMTRNDPQSPARNQGNPQGLPGSPGGQGTSGASTSTAGATGANVQRRENLTLAAGKGARDYVYTLLKNIRPNTLVNVYGVVKFFKPIAKTRGTDYYMVMSITDPSLEEADSTYTKLKCILFARDPETLPQISNVGDIVRLHRLSISTYQSQLQGQKGPGFACVVFEGTKGGSLTPISSTKTYTIGDDDLAQVERLRDWGEASDLLLDSQVPSANYDTFSDMLPGKYYNIVCQVVAISEVNTDVHFLFKCWDGTTCQHSVYEVDIEALNSEAFLREDRDLMSASTGYRLDVSVFDDHCEAAANVSVGDFVKFINLHATIHKDPNTGSAHGTVPMLELCLHRGNHYGRKMVVLPPNDPAVQQLRDKLDSLKQERAKVQEQLVERRRQWQLEQQQGQQEGGVRDNAVGPPQNDVPANVASTASHSRTVTNATASGAQNPEPVPSTSGYKARKRSIHEIANAREQEQAEESRLQSLRTLRETRSSPRKGVVQSPVTQSPRKTPQVNKVSREKEVISPSPTPKAKRSRISMLRGLNRSGNRSQVEEPVVPRTPDIPQCMQTTATVITDHHHIDPVTVDHILAKSLERASKFRLKAHVLNYEPKATIVQDFLHLHCEKCKFLSLLPVSGGATSKESVSEWQKTAQPVREFDGIPYFACPNCPRSSPRKRYNKGDMLQYTIAVKLLLEDETGCLVAQIWKENAHAFFDHVNPEDLMKKKRLFKRVMNELDSLCKSENSAEEDQSSRSDRSGSPPVMDCCIMSYSTSVGVCFQIFDTVLTSDLH